MASTRSTSPTRRRLLTPRNILIGLAVFVGGSLIGVGLFTFGFAGGWAYLGSDPATCAQCHAMDEQYEAWQRGSHQSVATCNDCHSPHDNIVHKYLVKGENGFRHALMFTTNAYPENIEITENNKVVANESCLYCHGELVNQVHIGRKVDETLSCIECHQDVGHL